MSTPTPTGNGHIPADGRHAGDGHADHLGKLVPWMLDEATLTRLAGDVLASFAAEALPGLDSSVPAADAWGVPSQLGQPSYYFIDEEQLAGDLATTAGPHGVAPDAAFDVDAVRADFPILGVRTGGRPLVWLDNAATTQKPR